MMADKGYLSKELKEELARKGIVVIRPATQE